MRKTLTIIFIFIIAQYKIAGQSTIQSLEYLEDKTLVRCFGELPENKYLDSIGLTLTPKKKFCYLWTCFSELPEENPKLNNEIYKRIKDIARKLHSENKAVIIVDDCENSIEEKSINEKTIQIINIGDCSGCIKFQEPDKRKKIFNDEIKNLFGILDEKK